MPIYMKFGGKNVACEEVHFDGVTPSPRDQSTGQASGRRQWGQVKILHAVGSSVQALKSLVKNQTLPGVQLQFTKTDQEGKQKVYYVVHLGNTKVVDIQPHVSSSSKHGSLRGLVLEYLEFDRVYRQITWTHSKGGKAFSDDWN